MNLLDSASAAMVVSADARLIHPRNQRRAAGGTDGRGDKGIRELRPFAGKPIDFRSTTLVPPLTRALFRLPGGRIVCTFLDVLPFSRTHFVAAVRV